MPRSALLCPKIKIWAVTGNLGLEIECSERKNRAAAKKNFATAPGPVAKYAHEKNHIDHPERAWLMWFFALELNCYEKLWNANSVYRS